MGMVESHSRGGATVISSDTDSKTFSCPTCSGKFDSELAVKVHHTKEHGESISEKSEECDFCGECFVKYESLQQHREEEHKDELYICECGRGFKNKNGWKIHRNKIHSEDVSGEPCNCDICGDTFRIKQYRIDDYDRNVCSKDCYKKLVSNRFSGEKSPHWKGGFETFGCKRCGSEFQARPTREQRFCSNKCRAKWVGENQRGEDHPLWKGGKSEYYGPNWQQQRRKALDRDNRTCQYCAKPAEDMDRDPDVHHIKPLREFKKEYDKPKWYQKANQLDNLITACMDCHRRWEGIQLKPQGTNL
jgi:hypothetical protein